MAGLSPPTRDCLPGKPVKHFVQPVCKINTTTEALFVRLTKKKKKNELGTQRYSHICEFLNLICMFLKDNI